MIAEQLVQYLTDDSTEATREYLRPLLLSDKDFLLIGLGRKDALRYFTYTVKSLRPTASWDTKEQVYTSGNGTLMVPDRNSPSVSAKRLFFEKIPECKYLGGTNPDYENQWQVAATDFSAIITYLLWPKEKIIFIDEDAKVHFQFLVTRFAAQSKRARIAAEFKINGITPTMPDDFIEHKDFTLSDYQKVGTAMGIGHDCLALFCDPGTGKTYMSIALMCLESARVKCRQNRMYRFLVVCPRQVRVNWQEEIQKFTVIPGKVTIIKGDPIKRVKLLTHVVRNDPEAAFSCAIIGIDTVADTMEALRFHQWDAIIVDESHLIKNKSSKRFISLAELRDLADKRIILTGSPIANSINDLFSQLEFLGMGLSGFTTKEEFKKFHGKYKKIAGASGNGVEKLVALRNIPLLQERLSRLAYFITAEEAKLGLPDNVYDVREVQMTPHQAECYSKLADELAFEIESELKEDTRTITANHVFTKLLRLGQITSGYIKWNANIDPETGDIIRPAWIEHFDPNPKLDELMELIQDDPRNVKGVIWAIGVEEIQAISKRFTERGLIHGCYYGATPDAEREIIKDRFNKDPSFQYIIANPKSAREGMNLLGYDVDHPEAFDTYVGRSILYSYGWSILDRIQLLARTRRRGTKMPVKVTELMVPGSIDQTIRTRLGQKSETALTITDIREILKSITSRAYEEE